MEKATRAMLEWQGRLRDEDKRLREMELDTREGEVGLSHLQSFGNWK